MSKKKSIRVLTMSDTHCGHDLGLTPPDWDPGPRRSKGHYDMRRTIWDWFEASTQKLSPNIIIFNGDAIDGRGEASKGTEILYPDRKDQVAMAADILGGIRGSPAIYMSYGTGYHTGKGEDFEDSLAEKVGAVSIGGEDNLEVLGNVINYKHHLGRSAVPHSRATAVLRDALWNSLWAERGEYPKARILLRSHVHYHIYAGGPDFLAMTLPSLQGYGTKYGGRRMTGTVDVGFVVFDLYGPEDFSWKPYVWRANTQKAKVYKNAGNR